MKKLEPFQNGQPAHLPHEHAIEVGCFHYYDGPIIGVFDLYGTHWMFENTDPPHETRNVLWNYFVVPSDQVFPMFDNVDSAWTWYETLVDTTTIRRAAYCDDFLITEWDDLLEW